MHMPRLRATRVSLQTHVFHRRSRPWRSQTHEHTRTSHIAGCSSSVHRLFRHSHRGPPTRVPFNHRRRRGRREQQIRRGWRLCRVLRAASSRIGRMGMQGVWATMYASRMCHLLVQKIAIMPSVPLAYHWWKQRRRCDGKLHSSGLHELRLTKDIARTTARSA